MLEPEARFEELMAKLRRRRWRMTPQRVAMLRILASSEDHPSAAQLFDRLRAQFPTTSLGTVYKTLSTLQDMGEVLDLGFSDDDRRYDGRRATPHPHLICVRCHRIADIDTEVDEDLIHVAAERSGFRVVGHRFDIYGLCPECQVVEGWAIVEGSGVEQGVNDQ